MEPIHGKVVEKRIYKGQNIWKIDYMRDDGMGGLQMVREGCIMPKPVIDSLTEGKREVAIGSRLLITEYCTMIADDGKLALLDVIGATWDGGAVPPPVPGTIGGTKNERGRPTTPAVTSSVMRGATGHVIPSARQIGETGNGSGGYRSTDSTNLSSVGMKPVKRQGETSVNRNNSNEAGTDTTTGSKRKASYSVDSIGRGNVWNNSKRQYTSNGSCSNNNGLAEPRDDNIEYEVAKLSELNEDSMNLTVQVKLLNKSMKPYNNGRNSGYLLRLDLMDAWSSTMKAVAFNAIAHDLDKMMEKDRTYVISDFTVKASQYSGDMEMSFGRTTKVIESKTPLTMATEGLIYNATPISHVSFLAKDDVVDVVGLLMIIGSLEITKTGAKKRVLTLMDASTIMDSGGDAFSGGGLGIGCMIELTLWGDEAIEFDQDKYGVPPDDPAGFIPFLIKGARVNEYMGVKTLSVSRTAMMIPNPNIPEAEALKAWAHGGDVPYMNNVKESAHNDEKNTGNDEGNNNNNGLTYDGVDDTIDGAYSDVARVYTISGTHLIITEITGVDGLNDNKVVWFPCCNKGGSPICGGRARLAGEKESRYWLCCRCKESSSLSEIGFNYMLNLTMIDDRGDPISAGCTGEVAEMMVGQKASKMEQFRKEGKDWSRMISERLLGKRYRLSISNNMKVDMHGNPVLVILGATPINK